MAALLIGILQCDIVYVYLKRRNLKVGYEDSNASRWNTYQSRIFSFPERLELLSVLSFLQVGIRSSESNRIASVCGKDVANKKAEVCVRSL